MLSAEAQLWPNVRVPVRPRSGAGVRGASVARQHVPLDHAVADVLAHGLDVVFCGINPGLRSAATGYHFAGPGNRFWPSLHAAGFTDRLLEPSEVGLLPRYGCGITNLVSRTTARADQLSDDEVRAGLPALEAKVARFAPRWLAVVGIVAYRTAFGDRRATMGAQGRMLGTTRVWVLPNTSGLNAHCRPADFARLFRELYVAVQAERGG